VAALLWIIISFATGGPVLFSLGGGILCGVVVFIIGYGFRRLVLDRRKAAPGNPELSAGPATRTARPCRADGQLRAADGARPDRAASPGSRRIVVRDTRRLPSWERPGHGYGFLAIPQ
jgi:hypothetical protein